MANWSDLKEAVSSIIKTNGAQEITGQLLQNVLNNIISNIGSNSTFAGIATPETNPGTPDGNVFYLATTEGTYSNFNGIVINSGEAVILEWKGSWVKKDSGFATKEKLSELGLAHRLINRINSFTNGNVTKNKQLYRNAEVNAPGCFITPYIEVNPNHTFTWYQGNDRSGTSVAINGLSLYLFNEDKSQYKELFYDSDPKTFSNFSSYAQFTVKYVRISFVKNIDCYLLDSTNKEFVWYGYYVGEDVVMGLLENSLTSSESNKALTANMGKILYQNMLLKESHNKSYYRGTKTDFQGAFTTDLIPINPSHSIKWYIGTDRSGIAGSVASLCISFFDSNKQWVADASYSSDPRTFTPSNLGSGIAYLGASFIENDDCYLLDVTDNSYLSYGFNPTVARINNVITELEQEKLIDSSKQCLYYALDSNGDLTGDTSSLVTDYINIENESTVYYKFETITKNLWCAFYDKDRKFISSQAVYTDITYMNLTKVANAVYFRATFKIGNTGSVVRGVSTGTVLWRYGNKEDITSFFAQNDDAYLSNVLSQLKRAPGNSSLKSILFFSDIHSSDLNMKRIKDFLSRYRKYVDGVLFGGDLMSDNITNSDVLDLNAFSKDALFTVGNHDICLGNSVTPNDYVPYSNVTPFQVYDKFIAHNVQAWGVVQPENAENGLNYYYKDYENIRLIVLDCFNPAGTAYISDERTWFEGVLNDAKTNNKHVVVSTHFQAGTITPADTGFCTKVYTTETDVLDGSFSNAVASYISRGGNFICWLSGHTHYDAFGTLVNHPEQTQLVITCSYSNNRFDNSRIAGDKSIDAFNIIAFDTTNKILKVLRIGNTIDRYLRPKNMLSWDYQNKTIISSN